MSKKWLLIALAAQIIGCAKPHSSASVITVFAAASTADALETLAELHQEKSGHAVRLSFASSSLLARQIEAGAHADLFVSANPFWMDHLISRQLVDASTRRDLWRNRLVLIVARDAALESGQDWTQPLPNWLKGRLAVGDPAHVPAGIYAKQALQHMGWWPQLKDRIAPAADVRTALRSVVNGETGAGIVYLSDARNTDRVRVVHTFAETSHEPIVYALAFTTAPNRASLDFYQFLQSQEARAIAKKFGFAGLKD